MKTELLFGTVLFGESQGSHEGTVILEVSDLQYCCDLDVDKLGEEYLNNGGDSYIEINDGNRHLIQWDVKAKKRYDEIKNVLKP